MRKMIRYFERKQEKEKNTELTGEKKVKSHNIKT